MYKNNKIAILSSNIMQIEESSRIILNP